MYIKAQRRPMETGVCPNFKATCRVPVIVADDTTALA